MQDPPPPPLIHTHTLCHMGMMGMMHGPQRQEKGGTWGLDPKVASSIFIDWMLDGVGACNGIVLIPKARRGPKSKFCKILA